MIPDPDDPCGEAISAAVEALATVQGTTPTDRTGRAAMLAQAARYVAAAQAALDKAADPPPDPVAEPPSVTLARLQGQITYMHHGSAGADGGQVGRRGHSICRDTGHAGGIRGIRG
jgi:hypothetical protein